MAALNVPTMKKAGSHTSLRSLAGHENDLAPVSRSRRNSDSSVGAPTLIRPATQHTTNTTTLYASHTHKPFVFVTKQLKEKLPFFKKLLTETPEPLPEQTTLDDTAADDASMALLQHWVSGSKALHGPTDFHSISHYLALYALAMKFQSEPLENLVMDLMRAHYAAHDLTAPPYRIEYINTYAPDSPMQGFMLATAARRCMQGKDRPAVSDTMYLVLQKGEMMREFLEYMVHSSDVDVRHGSMCA